MFNLSAKDIEDSDYEEKYRYKHSPFFFRITKGSLSYSDRDSGRWLKWFKNLYK